MAGALKRAGRFEAQGMGQKQLQFNVIRDEPALVGEARVKKGIDHNLFGMHSLLPF